MAENNNFNFDNTLRNSNPMNSNRFESLDNNIYRNVTSNDKNNCEDPSYCSTSFSVDSSSYDVPQSSSNVFPYGNMLPPCVRQQSWEPQPPVQNLINPGPLFPPPPGSPYLHPNSNVALIPPYSDAFPFPPTSINPPHDPNLSGAPFPPFVPPPIQPFNSGSLSFPPPNIDTVSYHPPNSNFLPFNPNNNIPSFPHFPPFAYTSAAPNLLEEEDELSIQNWLNKQKADRNPIRQVPSSCKLTISDYKSKVIHLATQIKELDKLTTHLQIMSKSLDDTEWLVRKMEVVNLKKAVEDAMNAVKTIPEENIISLLKRRKSKRARLKRKREEFKEFKKEQKAFCQLENSRIDMWLEKMKEQVERTRREEDIKKQADYVLSEVFHKKAEAKRMLSLLTTLGKLRNARIHDRESKGEFVSKDAAATFNSIIDNLKKRWLSQVNGYNFEEQGLRVMLSDAEVKRSNVEQSLNKQIQQQWLNIMFGENNQNNPLLNPSVDDLISIRKCWDQFIVHENVITPGSNIPCGWILPSIPSNKTWETFLKN